MTNFLFFLALSVFFSPYIFGEYFPEYADIGNLCFYISMMIAYICAAHKYMERQYKKIND